ncbi:hypothetical protein [Alloalcanivorax xenomutans]|uniref:hypothetical protein n=1 Tax=Alloalcanivorax xenomutans TaxID=1094342 RepID=UPI0009B5DE15|nr:hypothetical protein [Alloalcanivorax xenomutans]
MTNNRNERSGESLPAFWRYEEEEYDDLANRLEDRSMPSTPAEAERFVLAVLGDAMAKQRGWWLRGTDALEYALMLKYRWSPGEIGEMSRRDITIALHEELQHLVPEPGAVLVWRRRFQAELGEDVPGGRILSKLGCRSAHRAVEIPVL